MKGRHEGSVRPGRTPMKRSRCLAFAVLGLFALSSCAVGPNYRAPPPPPGPGFVPEGTLAAPTTASSGVGGEAQHFVETLDIPGQWWTLFQSSDLNDLIAQALAHNPTLEAAQASLRQANETALAGRGALSPSVSAGYQVTREKASGEQFGLPQLGSFLYTLNSASVNVSYTIDAFGGVRRQVESLRAQADYQRYALEASYLALTANVVTAAITEASLREQIAATERIAQDQRQQLDISQKRFDAGGTSRADVLQQQAALQSTLASLPPLRTQLAQQRTLLATYVGKLPADYAGAEFKLETLTLPTDLPVSVPSKFIEQRPDVQQYEALLHQSVAQIGVATANMLPQLTLQASGGADSLAFSDLFGPGTVIWSLIGGATQPVFKGGQLLHQRRAAVAAAQAAAANYKATVLSAFQDVANTLYALQGDADTLAANVLAERSAADSLALVELQYKAGGASFLQVLTAEQNHQTAAISLVKARAQRFADTAALFQALGGGWWNRSDPGARPQNAIPAPSFGDSSFSSPAPGLSRPAPAAALQDVGTASSRSSTGS